MLFDFVSARYRLKAWVSLTNLVSSVQISELSIILFWRHCILKQNDWEVTRSLINFHTNFSCHQKFILFNPLLYFAARNYYVKDLAHKFYGGFIIIIIFCCPQLTQFFLLGLMWPELGFFLIFSLSLACCLTSLPSILDGILP